MKRALCINSMEEIGALIRGEAETIDSCMVARDICEDPNNKFLQIVPYVVFYTPKHAEGKLLFAQYKRAAKGGDDRLLSKVSLGFGGHIDDADEIKCQSKNTAEDTTDHFVMTKQDLVDTCITAAKRELVEELGCDILTSIGADLNFEEAAFFMGDQRDPVNQVHLGLGLPVRLTEEQFAKFFENAVIALDEIEVLDKMTANIRHIVEEMDVSATNGKIMNQLVQQHGFEDWSVRMFDYIVRKEIFVILRDVNYDDLYRVAVAKQQAREAEEAQKAAEGQANDAIVPATVDNPDLDDAASLAEAPAEVATEAGVDLPGRP